MFADHRLIAVRQLADETIGAGGDRRRLDLGIRRVEAAIGDIGPHRVVEQADLL